MIRIIVIACLLFCFTACHSQTTYTYENQARSMNISFNNNADSTLIFQVAGDSTILMDYFSSLFPNPTLPLSYITKVSVSSPDSTGIRYLIVECNNRIFAQEVTLGSNNKLAPIDLGGGLGGTTHTCTGDPCSCCVFRWQGSRIIGCACYPTYEHKGDKCNHTITTSQ